MRPLVAWSLIGLTFPCFELERGTGWRYPLGDIRFTHRFHSWLEQPITHRLAQPRASQFRLEVESPSVMVAHLAEKVGAVAEGIGATFIGGAELVG